MITSTLGRMSASALATQELRNRFTELTEQVASGNRSTSYAGLGTDARQAIDLRSERALRETFMTSIRTGEAFAQSAQTALTSLVQSTTGILDRFTRLLATGLPGSDANSVQLTAEQANSALKEVISLLGERFAGEAIFGGSDPTGTPVIAADDIETNGFYLAIGAAVTSLGTGAPPKTAQAVLADTLAIARTNNELFVGNAKLQAEAWSLDPNNPPNDPRRSVPIGDGQLVGVGLYVYRNGTSPVDNPVSTGSWARDIVRALATIAQFDSSNAVGNPQYAELAKGALDGLRAGLDGLIREQGSLGYAQQRLAKAAERNEDLILQLDRQVAGLESVDVANAITELMNLRSQLEASYRAAVLISDLTLTRFLR